MAGGLFFFVLKRLLAVCSMFSCTVKVMYLWSLPEYCSSICILLICCNIVGVARVRSGHPFVNRAFQPMKVGGVITLVINIVTNFVKYC